MFYYLHHSQPEIQLLVALISPSFYFTLGLCVLWLQYIYIYLFSYIYYIIFLLERQLLFVLLYTPPTLAHRVPNQIKPHPLTLFYIYTHIANSCLYIVLISNVDTQTQTFVCVVYQPTGNSKNHLLQKKKNTPNLYVNHIIYM